MKKVLKCDETSYRCRTRYEYDKLDFITDTHLDVFGLIVKGK